MFNALRDRFASLVTRAPQVSVLRLTGAIGGGGFGKGLTDAALAPLIARAFDHLDLDVLHAVVDPGNGRSERVALRCGMRHAGQTSAYYGRPLEHFEIRRAAATASRPRRS